MSTHFKDYESVEGQFTACGRYYPNNGSLGRGVVISTKIGNVSCQGCLRTERFKLAKARVSRPLDAPIPERFR